MLFLCASDLHGFAPGAPGFGATPDALLLLGDLEWSAGRLVGMFPDIPVFGVPGNHDYSVDPFCGTPVENLHGRAVEFGGVRIGGLGGSLRYKPGDDFLFWDAEYREILRKMPPVDIFISHCPPAGLPWCDTPSEEAPWHGAHEGSAALAEYIYRMQPAVVLCGHLHLSAGKRMGKTLVRVVYGVEMFEYSCGLERVFQHKGGLSRADWASQPGPATGRAD
ncbi:Predicted phosphoesterase [Thermanaeromonas toyohensis ToBE]|uniref:Predicted phosphoesterase n=1 Tax=Thermanaeromonas toyohensis ToBE TaxID=698762 RepID=A0A1W1VSJ2_9FIRM|nr:Predicted phosphoesterase [Thermanaeromonas toyohensis ToBE]